MVSSYHEIMAKFVAKAHGFAYDLLVLGGGSGGVRAGRIAASYGARVCLIENAATHGPPTYTAMGGTCVNVGCVPKKLMVYGSHYSEALKDAAAYGWNVPSGATHSWHVLTAALASRLLRLTSCCSASLAAPTSHRRAGAGSWTTRTRRSTA